MSPVTPDVCVEAITGKRGVSIARVLIASRGLPGATKPASA